MKLTQGYNIVTSELEETETHMTGLEFFRSINRNEEITTPVTVTGVEDVIYNAVEAERTKVIEKLRNVLRNSRSIQSMDAVQIVLDGSIVTDNAFRVRVECSGGTDYIDIGKLFVEQPKPVEPGHYVARK